MIDSSHSPASLVIGSWWDIEDWQWFIVWVRALGQYHNAICYICMWLNSDFLFVLGKWRIKKCVKRRREECWSFSSTCCHREYVLWTVNCIVSVSHFIHWWNFDDFDGKWHKFICDISSYIKLKKCLLVSWWSFSLGYRTLRDSPHVCIFLVGKWFHESLWVTCAVVMVSFCLQIMSVL